MNTAIMVVLVMTGIGLVFGLILAFANKAFAIETNPLIEIVEDVLPKGQCGACGYAGCAAYAEAVVLEPDVAPNLCVPGKKIVADQVAEITGKVSAEIEPRVAQIKCNNPISDAIKKYNYVGLEDCIAASLVQGGPKGCQYGCMGFGTCAANCPFDALTMGENGLPIVDEKKCTGCGKCSLICPKHVITMAPIGAPVAVLCNSKDKGAAAKKVCSVACIGCGACKKSCPYDAITVENNLATVNGTICLEKCNNPICLEKCPTGAIVPLTEDAKKASVILKEAVAKAKAEKAAQAAQAKKEEK
ncbi:Fe-S cluster domain-containing protein [Acetobacterium paludosum]|uniref:Ion-translocating oxidoreductase complex subunit B n=1 Tax=Acetobacterium paludosum TaxID=52693 RepID=A0A923HY03_9FIRM|nr:Fe-S cluster domain-containing protein [Acetobacterium paludosum]MBC3888071.1 Fe-S cluster domain-containing protein [Acetobacterium paludosum]